MILMKSQFAAPDGAVGSPGYFFANDTDTGFYRIGANNVGLALGGVTAWNFAATATTFSGANSTSNTTFTVENTSNAAAASHAIIDIKVGGTTSTGDPQLRLSIPSGTSWYVGVDNSSSDRLFIGSGTTVGGSGMLRLDAGATAQAGTTGQITLFPLSKDVATAGTDAYLGVSLGGVTATVTNTTQRTNLFSYFNAEGTFNIAQSGGAVTVDKAASIAVAPPVAGASVTLTHGAGIRVNASSSVAVNLSGLYVEALTGGTTGNYQILLANGGGARPALTDFVGVNAIDFAAGDARLMIQAEAGIEISIGNSTVQPNSATEMAFCVTNESLTVGSEGSVVIPYLSTTDAAFTDALGGNVNGAIAINYDSDTGPTSTIEARVEGAWLSVAVTGYLIQSRTFGGGQGWWHPRQIIDDRFVDETVCVVCGEPIEERQAVSMYANLAIPKSGMHAVFGHQHPERDEYVQGLERRIAELESGRRRR